MWGKLWHWAGYLHGLAKFHYNNGKSRGEFGLAPREGGKKS